MKKVLLSATILTLLVAPVIILAAPEIATGGGEDVTRTITSISNWIFGLLIIGAVIMILIAAFTFLTSAGDPEKTKTARNYVVYALVALVVAFLAQALVQWFSTNLTN